MAVEPIRRTKLYQEIATRLENQILDGHLKAGDFLPSERELMNHFGVGKPAIREALLALHKSGLIAVSTGERSRVVQPSAAAMVDELGSAARYLLNQDRGIREFQQARTLFETALARYAAVHATTDDLQELKKALNANEAAAEGPEFIRTDVEFHHAIAKVPRNSIFEALHSAHVGWLTDQRVMSSQITTSAKAAVKGHRAIFKAISSGDPDAAEREMCKHLTEVEAAYWKARGSSVATD